MEIKYDIDNLSVDQYLNLLSMNAKLPLSKGDVKILSVSPMTPEEIELYPDCNTKVLIGPGKKFYSGSPPKEFFHRRVWHLSNLSIVLQYPDCFDYSLPRNESIAKLIKSSLDVDDFRIVDKTVNVDNVKSAYYLTAEPGNLGVVGKGVIDGDYTVTISVKYQVIPFADQFKKKELSGFEGMRKFKIVKVEK